MRKLLLVAALMVVAFAVLLPFASTTPDGLQTLTDNAENVQQPVWGGLMAEYSVAIGYPYVSTLVAGLFGTGIVLAAGFAVGSVSAQKKPCKTAEAI